MRAPAVALLLFVLIEHAAAPARADNVVTIYSADGLYDGTPSWYETQFDAFTRATGIRVQYIEGGSGVVVERVEKEASNPQADVLVTLPPFIQKAASDGFLQPYEPAGAATVAPGLKDKAGRFTALVNNYPDFIYDSAALDRPPKTFLDLLDPKFKGKMQYSTPGEAGDGTAVMVQVFHAFKSKDAAFAYLQNLESNNVGPSSSTGKLSALVNKGELYVANGDLQMNVAQQAEDPNIKVFWPASPDGKRSTFALPFYIALVKSAPHADAGKKLIDFLLSRDAQRTVGSIAHGLPVRNDIASDGGASKRIRAMMAGVATWTPDWGEILKDLQADVARWRQVTGN